MAVLLDTDHFSILQHNQPAAAASCLQARLKPLPAADVKVSIISFQEQVQGWLAWIHRARKPDDVVKGFRYLQELLRHYAAFPVLPFDASAATEVVQWKQQGIRVGTSDLRIAAIATVHGVKLLSRNLRDFRQVPHLDVEDWTI